MKIFTFVFLLALFCFSVQSCSPTKSGIYKTKFLSKITIPLDTAISDKISFIEYNDENNMVYFALLQDKIIYNFQLKSLSHLNSLSFDNKINCFKIISKDSIYIFQSETNSISLINKNGLVKNCTNFDNIFFKNYRVYIQFILSSLMKIENSFILPIVIDPSTRKEYYDMPIAMKYDLNSQKTKFGIYWPPYYCSNKELYAFEPSIIMNKKKELLVSFLLSDYVYRYDSNFKFIDSIKYKSKYQEENFPALCNYNDEFPNNDSTMRYLDLRQEYASLKYDKYRDLYYRIFLHKVNNQHIDEPLSYFDKTFSLIVIDSEFNILNEEVFSGIDYNFNSFFITPEGISFVSNNRKSNDYNADSLRIVNFKVDL